MVQWLRLHASNTGGTGLIPGWGTKILHASQFSQKKKKSQIDQQQKEPQSQCVCLCVEIKHMLITGESKCSV